MSGDGPVRARLLFDEDSLGPILEGTRLHHPAIDAIGARDVLAEGTPDPEVLAWAADNRRVVVSSDRRTMTADARRRMRSGLCFPGMIVVPQGYQVGRALREIASLVEASAWTSLEDRIWFLPLDKGWRVMEETPEWAAAGA